jgi:glycosyltransferase involved in cell wall biosynthesis
MRVLHVITGLGIGGAEQQLRLLLRHLPAECEVATLSNPGAVADGLRADEVPVMNLGMHGNRDVSVLPRLAWLIRTGRYDVVHTHLYRACVYGRVAARLAGVRTVVATEHSLGETQIEGRPLTFATRALYRATERLGSGTLAVSETVARRLGGWGVRPGRVHLAPNGIDPEAFAFSAAARATARAHLGIPQDAYVVGGVGRQVPGKHFDALIRAVTASRDAHLLLVGDGPERTPLLRIVHQVGAGGRVRFAGSHEHTAPHEPGVPELLSAMDLFVSPSPEESFGLAVVEALAAGLPVLYVACPALEDLPPEDAPGARRVAGDELAAAIRQELLAGPRRMPVPAAVDHYHIARTAEAVMALYTAATTVGTAGPVPAPAAEPSVGTSAEPAAAAPAAKPSPETPAGSATVPGATPAPGAPGAQAGPTAFAPAEK